MSSLTIPTSQLETWARYIDAPQSKRTVDLIRTELEQVGTTIVTRAYEVYLQGSYRNSTNIFRDSDVDLVVELKGTATFYSGVSQLTLAERHLKDAAYGPGTVRLEDFRDQVFQQLARRFGRANVKDGNKAIKVGGYGERLNADVLVCAEYRKWQWFRGSEPAQHSYVPGITFWTQNDHRQVVNYPKVHLENGVAKQESSRQWFKQTVRMVKNARRLMYDRDMLQRGSAPSYFIQCLLYNVPDQQFGLNQQQNYRDVVKWLREADAARFTCQHGQHLLFGPSHEQWDLASATNLIRGLQILWDTWR